MELIKLVTKMELINSEITYNQSVYVCHVCLLVSHIYFFNFKSKIYNDSIRLDSFGLQFFSTVHNFLFSSQKIIITVIIGSEVGLGV